MPQVAPLAISQNKNYSVINAQSDVAPALWVGDNSQTYGLKHRLTAQVRRSGSKTASKAVIRVTMPFADANGVLLGSAIANVEFTMPDNMGTTLTPALVLQEVKDVLANTTISSAITDGSSFY